MVAVALLDLRGGYRSSAESRQPQGKNSMVPVPLFGEGVIARYRRSGAGLPANRGREKRGTVGVGTVRFLGNSGRVSFQRRTSLVTGGKFNGCGCAFGGMKTRTHGRTTDSWKHDRPMEE